MKQHNKNCPQRRSFWFPGRARLLHAYGLFALLGAVVGGASGCDEAAFEPDAGAAPDAGKVVDSGPVLDASSNTRDTGTSAVCVSNGVSHAVGERFPSSDGCNTCSCTSGGQIACTEIGCQVPPSVCTTDTQCPQVPCACLDDNKDGQCDNHCPTMGCRSGQCVDVSPPVTCGGIAGKQCGAGQYCDFPMASCGSGDQSGTCQAIPSACDASYAPVCGCDSKVYSNACVAASAGVSVAASDSCKKTDLSGTLQVGASCGGLTPADAPTCAAGLFCQNLPGSLCGAADGPGQCVVIPGSCPAVGSPVCGCDGQTYASACKASLAQVGILDNGACK